VYLAHYLSYEIFPNAKPLDFALVGGLNFSVAMIAAPFANLLTRLSNPNVPIFLGVVTFSAGFVAASFANEIWHLYLSQGVLVGIGVGFTWIPANALIPNWFTTKRSLASGICAAGSGVGGLVMCFSTQAMLESFGLAWTLRATACIVFTALLMAATLIRQCHTPEEPVERMFDWRLMKRYRVVLLLSWSFITMFGYITLMFSLSDYALSIGRSHSDSATVAAILNLGAAIGRPMIGLASDRWGRINVAGVLTFATGILVFVLWLPTMLYGCLLAFALISGATLGVYWVVSTRTGCHTITMNMLTG
jgi:MFS family permease